MRTDRLNPMQAMTLTSASIFSVDVLRVQRLIVNIAKQDAWISLALGGLLTLAAGMAAYLLASLYPDKDFPEIHLDLCGNFFGRILLMGTIIYVLLYISFSLRIFAQALKMFLLDRTPMYTLVVFMVLAAGYAVYKGIYTIGAVVDILFPFTIITVVIILLLSIPQAELIYLKPVMFENTKGILKSVMPSYQQFTGYGVILYSLSCTSKSRSTFFWFIAGILIPVTAYVSLTAVSIAVFGPKDVVTLIYPTLTLLKAIEFPATFLERMESFAVVLWIGIAYISVVLFYHASTRNLVVMFGIKSKHLKFVVWGQVPILVFMAMYMESGLQVLDYAYKSKMLQPFLGLIVIPLMTVAALFKKRKERGQ